MHKGPALTVDAIILVDGKIVLVRRKNPPFRGRHALPGGFVEQGETVEAAAVRETEEETGLKTAIKSLFGVYSDPDRDPRGHTVTLVFEMAVSGGELKAGDDASDAGLFSLDELPELAFDHSQIIKDFLERRD
jgi:8-oxo-dGTP diphosphatase